MATCSQGHENKEGAKFCNKCGDRLEGGQINCPHCNTEVDSKAKFCNKCGKNVRDEFKGLKWQREVDDFATRVDVESLESVLQKGIIVEHGTRALLLKDGALSATLEPGRYELKSFVQALRDSVVKGAGNVVSGVTSFFSKVAAESVDKTVELMVTNNCTVILVDAGDVELQLNMTGIKTKDPLDIDVTCKVIAQIENPAFFFTNVIKGRKNYLISALRGSLYDELGNALREVVGTKSVTDLNYDLTLKKQFEVSVENHLRTTFQRNGLNFVQLRTVDYNFKAYSKIKGIYEETFLLISEEEAKLQQRKRLFDVYDQTQLQDIIEQGKEVEYREKRQKVWADMRVLVNSDKMNEIKSVDDLEAFIHEVDKGKLLREDEVKELMNTFEQSNMSRKFILEKIGLEQRLEAERIDMVGKEENKLAEWEVQAKKARRILEEGWRAKKDEAATNRDINLENAKTTSTVDDISRDTRDKDATVDQKIDMGKLGVDREKMNMGIDALGRMKEMKTKEKRSEMEIEAERLERLSKVGIEALISASGKEQAEMLKDLKKTEMLKDMSEEQILAMGAANSKELAEAFKEKFKGLSAAKQEELYKEMMQQKDKSMDTMQQMFNKALDTQRDATVGVAQGGKVVYPPYGGPGYPPGGGGPGGPGFYNVNMGAGVGGSEKVFVICPVCKTKVELKVGSNFCTNCGHNFDEKKDV
jgi:hypothetical protein